MKRQIRKWLSLVIFCCLSSLEHLNAQDTELFKTKLERIEATYGYVIGQEIGLEDIKNRYPHLELMVFRAQTAFNKSYGKAKDRIKTYLIDYYGYELFKTMDDIIKNKLSNLFSYSEVNAVEFIKEVEQRASGKIESPYLEVLLAFQYRDHPEDEFLHGYTQSFRTKGHYKSKGTDWSVKVPKSWVAKEAEGPNIIQKFINQYQEGYPSIHLMVRNLPFDHELSEYEIDELITEDAFSDPADENFKTIRFTKMRIYGNPGCLWETESVRQRLDQFFKTRMAQFAFIRKNQMYVVQGMVITQEIHKDLSELMNRYYPLFRLVVNSIVVHDQFK